MTSDLNSNNYHLIGDFGGEFRSGIAWNEGNNTW